MTPQRRTRDLPALIFLALTGALLTLWTLGDKPLATDEATSFFIAHLDWAQFWESLANSEVNGSAFYTPLRLWSDLGTSEFFLRLLPVFFAVLTPLLLFRVASRIVGRVYGMGAAILLLVNWMFVTNAQNLRSYSLSALMATATTLLLLKLVERPSWRLAAAYALSAAILLYAHFFGAWVLLAHVLSLFFLPAGSIPRRMLIAAYATTVALATPIAVFVLTQDQGQVDWIGALSVRQVQGSMDHFTGDGGPVLMIVSGVLCALAIAGFVGRRHEVRATPGGDGGPPVSWYWALSLLWLILPILGTLVVSFFKPLFEARYFLVALPALALCLALGISVLPRKWPALAVWVGLVVLSAAQLPGWYSLTAERVWARKTSYVTEHGRSDDGIIFYAPTVIRPFGYYSGYYSNHDDPAPPQVIYPGKDWLGYSQTRFNPPLQRILARARTHDRVWIVVGAIGDEPRRSERRALLEGLRSSCEDGEEAFLEIYLFSGCNSPGTGD